ncbi:hypothetical protein F2Q70_00016065 [Brassica cretica]|uniref:Uncharacterized protein n=1 Tax=Brassica cretica TaxID=69181 RepID=A0A8S9HV10_BRACR|nr:hypothetical protein F2Q70_00016065 [Brassica cretica]
MTERSFTVITAFKRTLSLSNPHTAACLKSSAFAENSKRWNRFLSIDLRRNLNNHMLEVEGVYVAVMKSYVCWLMLATLIAPDVYSFTIRLLSNMSSHGHGCEFLLSLCGNATRSHSGGTEHGTTVKKLQEFLLSLCGNATRSHSGGTEHGTTVKKLQEGILQ